MKAEIKEVKEIPLNLLDIGPSQVRTRDVQKDIPASLQQRSLAYALFASHLVQASKLPAGACGHCLQRPSGAADQTCSLPDPILRLIPAGSFQDDRHDGHGRPTCEDNTDHHRVPTSRKARQLDTDDARQAVQQGLSRIARLRENRSARAGPFTRRQASNRGNLGETDEFLRSQGAAK